MPAIFFVKLPAVNFRLVAIYGLVMFALQFAFLFLGMHAGITAGLTSLIMQVQIFFSIFFAAIILGEKLNTWQIFGAFISFLGIGLVALHVDRHISLFGFICILGAAATWGCGNLITKKISHINMMALVIWGCFIASIPMFILAIVIEGTDTMYYSLQHLSLTGAFSLFYIICFSTWVGYGLWNHLLSQYPVNMIVPYTLLVPIVGLLSSVIWLHEPLYAWKIFATLFVLTGLYINILGSRLLRRRKIIA
jgi:O-acetylserine/cysteine efflux transporter